MQRTSILIPLRNLHLAPSARPNDSFFLPLIQDAVTWDGDLCLQLQQYPIPWVLQTGGRAENRVRIPLGCHRRSQRVSIELSEEVLDQLLSLFQSMEKQQRRLRINLQMGFIRKASTILPRLFKAAAPILELVETDHPRVLELLEDSLSPSARSQGGDPPALNRMRTPRCRTTLVMEIKDRAHGISLGNILKDCSCPLIRLHLYVVCNDEGKENEKNEAEASKIHSLVPPTLVSGLRQNKSLQSLRLSGQNVGRLFRILSPSLQSHPSIHRLEVEDTKGDFLLGQDNGLSSILASPRSKVTHCSIFCPMEKQQETISLTTKRTCSYSTRSCFFPITADGKRFQAKSLTHLSIHARLSTVMVDDLLVNVGNFCPNLEELDLEHNDLESLSFRRFLDRPMHQRLERLARLYLGSNLLQYKKETKAVEKLFEALPRVDIGIRGRSCGSAWDSDNSCYTAPTFFSWSHMSPRAQVYKDWNLLGRYLILSQEPYLLGLWPQALAQVSRQLARHNHESFVRQANVIYQFVRSGAIPLPTSS